jgi:hypothetical protein
MKDRRSLPPELVAKVTKRDDLGGDVLSHLFQRTNRAAIERIGHEEWVTLYSYESDKSGSRCYFCALIPRKNLSRAMSHDSWDLMTVRARQSCTHATKNN